jgi:serine/threonine protein kinase
VDLSEQCEHRMCEHSIYNGTPYYMAPEVVNYELLTCDSDMWSTGVITY